MVLVGKHQMFKLKKVSESLLLALASYSLATTSSYAQEAPQEEEIERISVVGSNIKRASDIGALPVTAMTEQDIENTAAITGDELLRSIPQIGEVNFGASTGNGGVNDARGDVSSINLRGVGTGNTLTLLNGRRLVTHPGTQSENFVPVSTVNSNTLPVSGLRSLEILRDGAAAIYGSDAVAGVVNYALQDDYEGHKLNLSYGQSEGTPLDELTFSYLTGFDLNDKTHITASVAYYSRDGMMASERRYSRSHDLRDFPGLPEEFVGDTQLDNRTTATPWGDFVSDSLGRFHLQPADMNPDDCVVDLAGGVCADSGSFPRDLRFDRGTTRSLVSDVDRFNFYTYITHDLGNDMELFAEAIYYEANAERTREQTPNLTSQRFTVAADAAFNPFGEEVLVRSYRPLDAGPRNIEVDDTSYRALLGLKGEWNDWYWETAAFYSAAETNDKANRVNAILFQEAINSTDPSTAYNIFTGGDVNNPNEGDSTLNPQSVIDSFITTVRRDSETELASIDFKASNEALFSLPAGDVGIAFGLEYRHEGFEDDRDPLLDGSSPFTNLVTGATRNDASSVLGSSPTPDSKGSRNVASAFVEFIAPLIDSDSQYLEMQLAARYEDFSDVGGSGLKPKVALFWVPADWISLRASYAEGFRAPGLPQVTAEGVPRANTIYDPVQDRSYSVVDVRSGTTDLEPEDDQNTSFGIVLEPTESLTITADWWKIEQEDLVGILPGASHLALDFVRRSQGSTNSAVERDPVSGDVIRINNEYLNLGKREISGIDFSVIYDLETSLGDFEFTVNAAHLKKFDQEPSDIDSELIAFNDAGGFPQPIIIQGAGDLLKQNGRPEWRGRASINWRYEQWGAGINSNYVGSVIDTSTTATVDGEVVELPVDSMTTTNVYVDYRIEGSDTLLDGSKIRFTVRNISDQEPPLADELAHGYFGALHSNRGRYFNLSYSKEF